ncbi:MAG TPA: CoB--CoM heterodisulfide reductase iron-sulfur subunit B family protein [Thermodesulfobacteriota bacterium]|nr:CoB--CoM heterodisulfide reductase iron-sulfur subunit B family protein [Thermodesulfobacteriota bacterium]
MANPLKYAYYPGCASQAITKEANSATRKIAEILGIELHDMPKANCCGAGLLTDYNYDLYLALNARIFAQAEEMGMDIMTICSTCLMVMSTANRDLKNDPKLLKKTNEILASADIKYNGTVRIKQLLWVLAGDYGLEDLKKKVTRPLKNLKVAPFYGCHSLRPSDALGFDNSERPWSLEAVISTLGAEAMEYNGKTKCCGFQVDLVAEDTAMEMTGKRLLNAKDEGGSCMVTPCPFCHINLDNYHGMAEKKAGHKINMPVFHLAQLVGLALGITAEELKLSRHLVSARDVLKESNLL